MSAAILMQDSVVLDKGTHAFKTVVGVTWKHYSTRGVKRILYLALPTAPPRLMVITMLPHRLVARRVLRGADIHPLGANLRNDKR